MLSEPHGSQPKNICHVAKVLLYRLVLKSKPSSQQHQMVRPEMSKRNERPAHPVEIKTGRITGGVTGDNVTVVGRLC